MDGNVVHFSSSTPAGWLLLVRSVPGGRDAPIRPVPLAFGALGVVPQAVPVGREPLAVVAPAGP